jgi:dihydrofolate reductase
MKPEVIIIAAMTADRLIGSGDKLPWHYPDDFKFFKEQTKGHAIVFGRRTYLGLPKRPLPGRLNIVLSPEPLYEPEVIVCENWEDVLQVQFSGNMFATSDIPTGSCCSRCQPSCEGRPKLFIGGGAMVYKTALDSGIVDTMLLTEIKHKHEGDIYFPEFNPDDWETPEILDETADCIFRKYRRKK